MAAGRGLLASFVAVVVLSTGGTAIHLSRGDVPLYARASPDGSERVEFRAATRWGALVNSGADMPGFVRLHDRDGHAVDSATFELSGSGPTIWTDKGVQVGTSAIYDRASGSWTVI